MSKQRIHCQPDPFEVGFYVSIGDRVELHPATDRWMMGDRFGEVVGITDADFVRVKLDVSGKILRFAPRYIGKKI